jgi:anti-sigma factor RsiW
MNCTDIDSLSQTFLDGELADEEQRELEIHLVGCGTCRDKVEGERSFHDDLRRILTAPPAPDTLRRRLAANLDAEDARAVAAVRRRRGAWLLPGAAMAAAAAALLVFVMGGEPSQRSAPVAYDAARQHMKQLPIEVQGAGVSPWLSQNFMPAVAVPRFGSQDDLVGARLSHLRDRDAAQLYYRVKIRNQIHSVQAHIIDASGMSLAVGSRVRIGGRELWVGSANGLSVVTYKDKRGVGYFFTSSDLSEDQMVDLVANSNMLSAVNDRLRR